MSKKGMVYLVGAGPGDEELITVKGLRLLQSCEVVVYDRLVAPLLIEEVPDDCEKIYVGKRGGSHTYSQEEINHLLVQKGLEGKRVVRLKGGDPFVFGRGSEEIQALILAGIPYEVVPGITSAIAVPMYAGIPVTHRGISQSFHVITGSTITHQDGMIVDIEALAHLNGTLIFLMGMSHLSQITEGLMKYGKAGDTPVCIISNGVTAFQKEVRGTLENIVELSCKHQMEAPTTIIIGEVVRSQFFYKKDNSLFKRHIALMMTEQLADKIAGPLQLQGAKVIKLGASKVQISERTEILLEVFDQISTYDWVVFTSTYAVDLFFLCLRQQEVDHRKLSHLHFAVIGSGTRETLKKYGFIADHMPEKYTTTELAKGLSNILGEDDSVFIPRAVKGSTELISQLEQVTKKVVELKLYDTVVDEERLNRQLLQINSLDFLVFGSSAGVVGFIESSGQKGRQLLENSQIICIGEITAKCLEAYGYMNYKIAKTYTAEGVVNAIMQLM